MSSKSRVITLIFTLFLSGVGVQEIANRLTKMGVTRQGSQNGKIELSHWKKMHVYHIIKNEAYTGTLYVNHYKMVKMLGQRKKKESCKVA